MNLGVAMPFFGRSEDRTMKERLEREIAKSKTILGKMTTAALDQVEQAGEIYRTTQGVIERMERLQNEKPPRSPS